MRRPLLLSSMVLGLVITAVGGMGVFAPFTDQAISGPNDVSSGERPRAADLQIAWPAAGFGSCVGESFADISSTPGVVATDVQPGYQATIPFCLRNAGSLDLTITSFVSDVVDLDFACTGDEGAAGDTTCGGDGQGELGNVIANYLSLGECGANTPLTFIGFVGEQPSVPSGVLPSGDTWCGALEVFYPLNRPDTDVLQAQSDRLTWRLSFNGTS
jgi:hypothetical protein